MQDAGLVREVKIEGGFFAWLKVAPHKTEIEGIINKKGCVCIDKKLAGKKVKVTIMDSGQNEYPV